LLSIFCQVGFFCVFVLVFVNTLFKVCLKFVSPDVKTVFLYGRNNDFCIFSRGKDKGNHYWALPNHAFDNVLAVVKVGPQSKMGL
jgi:hypothetical protein